MEIVLCRQDGSELPVDIALRPGRLGGTGQVVGAVRDASERKQLEQALWHSEQRLRLLVGGVADYAIFMLDPQGRVVSWNEGAERIKGWRREEILGEHLSRFYPPEQAATGPRPGRWRRRPGRPGRGRGLADAQGRVTVLGQRGGTAVYDEAGALHGFAKVTRDLTERRQLEGQQRRLALLAERERIAGGLFEQIVQGMFAVGLELQAATFADDSTLRAKVDAAVQHLDEVIVDCATTLPAPRPGVGQRTIRTGRSARWTTLWATLPSSSAVRSPRPWEPITITPAWQALAVSTMIGATGPARVRTRSTLTGTPARSSWLP